MDSRIIRLSVLLVGLTAGMLLLGSSAQAGEMTIKIEPQRLAFTPLMTMVHVGDRVTWNNEDDVDHYLTSAGPAARGVATKVEDLEFHRLMSPGDDYSHTFTMSGTYAYYCAIHIGMSGVVVVEP